MSHLIPAGLYTIVHACPRHAPAIELGLFAIDCSSCTREEIEIETDDDAYVIPEPPNIDPD